MVHFDLSPSSLHPHLTITPPSNCAINVTLTLPDALFPDPSELQDKWPEPGVKWSVTPEVIDIERPLDPLASDTVLTLEYRTDSEVKVPLHARYLPPRDGGWDVTFPITGTCDCGNGVKRVDEVVGVHLPAAREGNQLLVEVGTAVAVWTAWAWVAWKIWRVSRRTGEKAKVE